MSEENIENITKSDSNFAPNFNGHCLMKNNFSVPNKVINLYISYTLGPRLRNLNTEFTLGNCLFGSVKLAKNADLDKYKYTGYGIGFGSHSEFLFTGGSYQKIVIIFRADTSSSVYFGNKGKNILILGGGPTQILDDTTLTAEAIYPINFLQTGKRFVLSPHNNGSNNFLFVNAIKVYQFKAKNSEMKDYALCLGSILKDFTIKNMKKTRLKGVAKCFLGHYRSINTNEVLDIHKYLMKELL